MALIASITQLVGTILVAVGLWMAWPPLGVAVAGLMLVGIGLSLERRD